MEFGAVKDNLSNTWARPDPAMHSTSFISETLLSAPILTTYLSTATCDWAQHLGTCQLLSTGDIIKIP